MKLVQHPNVVRLYEVIHFKGFTRTLNKYWPCIVHISNSKTSRADPNYVSICPYVFLQSFFGPNVHWEDADYLVILGSKTLDRQL